MTEVKLIVYRPGQALEEYRHTTEDDQVVPGLFTVMHAAIGAHKAEMERITQQFWEACRAMKSVGLMKDDDDAGEDREAPR